MSILDKIIYQKKIEIEERKRRIPLSEIQKSPMPELRNFKSSLTRKRIAFITEIKKRSPSAGIIRESFDPVGIAQIYEAHGASAISILTDETFFGGKDDILTLVKQHTRLPVLRKEFIIDEYQIYESRRIGADAVLLIARLLSPHQLDTFIGIAGELGLTCLVEAHTTGELKTVIMTKADMIGINNRDLETFNVDMKTSLLLKEKISENFITISESGIQTRDQVILLEKAGFHGILIGSTLLQAEDIGSQFDMLQGKSKGIA